MCRLQVHSAARRAYVEVADRVVDLDGRRGERQPVVGRDQQVGAPEQRVEAVELRNLVHAGIVVVVGAVAPDSDLVVGEAVAQLSPGQVLLVAADGRHVLPWALVAHRPVTPGGKRRLGDTIEATVVRVDDLLAGPLEQLHLGGLAEPRERALQAWPEVEAVGIRKMEDVVVAECLGIELQLPGGVAGTAVTELVVLPVEERRLGVVGWKPVQDIGAPSTLSQRTREIPPVVVALACEQDASDRRCADGRHAGPAAAPVACASSIRRKCPSRAESSSHVPASTTCPLAMTRMSSAI